jgi:hypothetical protein
MFKYLVLIVILTIIAPVFSSADVRAVYPTNDTFVSENYPDTNYGSREYVTIGYINGSVITLIEFDLSIYAGTTINWANLYLRVYAHGGAFPTDNRYIAFNDTGWDEGTVVWNNRPGIIDPTPISGPSTYDWWIIDIADWVQDIVDGTVDNYGFQIYKYNSISDWFSMHSKEYGTSTYHPKLIFDFEETAIESASLGNIKAAFK